MGGTPQSKTINVLTIDPHIMKAAKMYSNFGYVGVVVSALLEHIERLNVEWMADR